MSFCGFGRSASHSVICLGHAMICHDTKDNAGLLHAPNLRKLSIFSKSRYNVDLILVLYTTKIKSTLYRLLLKIFSF